ncbi:MAG: CHAT domain-containing protein [Caldilinea sp. CFX5]|nr:CHAT domain-containing protein [Caldilinea sp. CFX5]
MTPQTFLDTLLSLANPTDQLALIREHLDLFDNQGAEQLKNQAIQYRFEDSQKALQIAEALLTAGQLQPTTLCRGYGLWASAVVHSTGLGDYERALTLYQEAMIVFGQENDAVSIAKMQISRIWALANLNRITEAFAAGEEAMRTLTAINHWYALATLQMNLASIYSRIGDDARAAAMYEQVQQAYEALAPMDSHLESHWAIAVQNRAISLFYLGKFAESIRTAQAALAVHERLGNRLEAARVRQVLGMINFMMGRYNQGLRLLTEVRTVFAADGSLRHTARVDLYLCDCLLHLSRFAAVLDKIPHLRASFQQIQSPHEEGIAVLYAASAYVGERQLDQALHSLEEARRLFVAAQNFTWAANCDLAKAHLFLRQARYAECLTLAHDAVAIFHQQQLAASEAEAQLLIAQAHLAAGEQQQAIAFLQEAGLSRVLRDMPALNVPLQQTLGRLSQQRGALDAAYQAYTDAITALEYLRGQLMVEHRITFQSNKQVIYEEMVSLCLQLNRVEDAFYYVEQAKSRALLDLIDNRIDLRIEVRNEADRPLVEQLRQLRSERDRLYRQSYDMEQGNERGWLAKPQDEEKQQTILRLEKEIGELWDTLLIRNADYAQDAVYHRAAPIIMQPALATDTLLLEYFTIQNRLLLFLVTGQDITVVELTVSLGQVKGLIERLHRHMQSVSRFPANQLAALEKQAQFLLQELYQCLLAPISERLAAYPKLIIVPHDALHYLPFHALYDGAEYLIERYEISYLPNAALWQRLRQESEGNGVLAVGCSANQQLPHTVQEAQRVAQLFQGDLLLEEAATHEQICQMAADKRLLHFATHAVYDAEQPLFSGLLVDDGWLTAFDVFNLHLQADLVTLSACQTGRSVVGGGDELLGLLRAFLYAGAKSLVVSQWPVADQTTALLMHHFYANLQLPMSKSAALRLAQQAVRQTAVSAKPAAHPYTHPYFWAAFFLIGKTDRFTR